MLIKKTTQGLMLALALTTGFTQAAQARDLRLAPGVVQFHPGYNPLYTEFQAQLPKQSDGKLNSRMLGVEAVSISEMRTGLSSGLVDVGPFLPAYFPADLPEMNLVGDLAFLGDDPQAMGAAMTEYIVTCGDCQAELRKLGISYTSSYSSNIYHVLSTKPIKDMADMKGMRLRVGGPQFSRWVEAMGATPVSTPVTETFEALSQGVIDGTVTSSADIVSFRLDDTVGYISAINLGTYHSVITHAVNAKTWKSLSAEERKAIAVSATMSGVLATDRWAEISAEAEQKDVEIIEPSEDLVAATSAFVESDLGVAAAQAGERYGIEKAAEKIARFRQLVDKWHAISEEAAGDSSKMAEAVKREVWDKVDFSTYGV
ncbi:C4-dicarboxylate TRAP transporter substrate-binding protein [Marinobacterium lutimaris]|uniref:TRAP-type C4-dicarboxylate transport system, substrate-binding protein n=1 Tax=Marinobacterium lutimaris TaxID=568106 RepID=A0A1H6CQI8_9GAMM|nr:C4-dicarboxylate TRAP transporter substrate-binding protein [Marinobacterium lutimaris]SEG75013.1 TRAP-type C4-dicarboxylate transport system, substrate-binding protein [Marinobacterium lutimaris]